MIAGIDIGGTKIRWVILDARRRVVTAKEIKVPRGRDALLKFLRTTMEGLKKRGVKKMGIGIAGKLSGTLFVRGTNLPELSNVDFKDIVPKGIVFRIDNDARCFARGEAVLGRGRKAKRMLAITLGTGVGRAVAENGEVIKDKKFEVAEPWEAQYQKDKKKPERILAIFLGEELFSFASQWHPDLLVLGGGTFRTAHLFDLVKKELQKRGAKYQIHRSHFRQNTAAVGAALLVV